MWKKIPNFKIAWVATGDVGVDDVNVSLEYTNVTDFTSMRVEFVGSGSVSHALNTPFVSDPDWTRNESLALTMQILGHTNLSELSVTVEDSAANSAVQTISDTTLLQEPQRWQELLFDLAGFGGVDLTNIAKITLGITPATGESGIIFIDTVRLQPCRAGGVLEADFNGDCTVDYKDFADLVDKWGEFAPF